MKYKTIKTNNPLKTEIIFFFKDHIKHAFSTAVDVLHQEGVIGLIKKFFRYYLFSLFLMPWLVLEAKKIGRNSSLKTIVNFGMADNFGLLRSGQINSEIHALLSIVKALKPQVIVEIGTATGGTLFMLSRVLEPKGILISIDLPYGKFGGGYHVWKIPLYKSFATEKQKIYLLRVDSHKLMTLKKLKQLLDKQLIDFLFIDGDHSAKGVMKDFKMYSGLVRKGGLIAFHDIVSCSKSSDCKVDLFWNKIKRTHQYQEIINDKNQDWGGIGILKC